jgi:nicotinamide phosphoribosyltransferase
MAMLKNNVILNADSYKISHWMFLEENTTYSASYIEARRGAQFAETVFFGLQYILKENFLKPVTMEMVDEAEKFLVAHGEPFNREGWETIVRDHNGHLPIRIRAVPEGMAVPVDNALVTVETTDPRFNAVWAASFIETKLMRVWYPTTIATLSREFYKRINAYMHLTGTPEESQMKLVDFGARGVSSTEQAMIGGAAHLVNFNVTDNLLGITMSMDYYNESELTGFSIPATEHSVTTSWGKLREFDFFKNIVENILPKTKICSVVCDTYNLMGAIEMFGRLRDKIEASGGTIVIRPDSGDPVDVTGDVVRKLDDLFGGTVNEKGFRVLNPAVRIIQGDGIDLPTVTAILDNFYKLGYSADNITFGSGGALLQKVNRDTMRFAMKASHVIVDGEERDIQKVPETDPTKASKRGKLTLVRDKETKKFRTVNQHDQIKDTEEEILQTVFENGKLVKEYSFSEVRKNVTCPSCP